MNAKKDAISDPCKIFNDVLDDQAWDLAGIGFCIINSFSKSEWWCSSKRVEEAVRASLEIQPFLPIPSAQLHITLPKL